MNKVQSLEQFYKTQLDAAVPELWNQIGHFDVFSFNDYASCMIKPIAFQYRNYLKIGLIYGKYEVHYADTTYAIDKQALLFTNSSVPYSWEALGSAQHGFFCLFTESFFHHFGDPGRYTVFQPGGLPVINISDHQAIVASRLFEQMLDTWQLDDPHKFDKMRVLVFELLFKAEKVQPAILAPQSPINAAGKITTQFMELLESQFSAGGSLQLRTPADYAENLAVHVNHLNKALKETLHKSTTEIIQDRILIEAKSLLKHTGKDISEIAFELGFKQSTHFHNFFKKKLTVTPLQYRAG